jgi:hypothetical protein
VAESCLRIWYIFLYRDNKFPAFYGIRLLLRALTKVRYRFSSYGIWIQSKPSHPVVLRSSLMASLFESQPEGRLHRMRISVVFLSLLVQLPECLPRLATTVSWRYPHRAFRTAVIYIYIYIYFQLNTRIQMNIFIVY